MKLPAIHGYIDRRMLINFTAEPEVVRNILPETFRPKIYNGKAIVGICLIRLKHIKPKGFPDFTGINSENGAHRIAVEWEENGVTKEGVYIPRRDTSLRLNALLGGRIFPGKHYFAKFNVREAGGNYHVDFSSSDNTTTSIDARTTDVFNPNSIFGTLENVSAFFERGAVGYSPNGDKYEGLKLETYQWQVRPLEAIQVHSSFYENETIFPKGSIQFDNALLMTQVEHEWKSMKAIKNITGR
ncbi:DUF2071 domain-containing protein [Chitinophaga pinensis]|uniref:DUF2071 domain-containing protein n=1 Tax=Chitinophaga pinensis (strain ATCC 43595 / DSM 2588 / LMG 13176 / NBRC 15968 / NCIMB 11800 / UQM 2034) TaxID=485918 RepID=A0A979G8U8_CHIPD|nr:DUF2071 domain-containing protein [Chitinophaga pinensis]ACU62802.1 hypothetical protein Cpin_5371 [Chitinophaga pinensis DSM 2588]